MQVVSENRGELTVQVDGRTAAKRVLFFFRPSVEEVLEAVWESGPNEARS